MRDSAVKHNILAVQSNQMLHYIWYSYPHLRQRPTFSIVLVQVSFHRNESNWTNPLFLWMKFVLSWKRFLWRFTHTEQLWPVDVSSLRNQEFFLVRQLLVVLGLSLILARMNTHFHRSQRINSDILVLSPLIFVHFLRVLWPRKRSIHTRTTIVKITYVLQFDFQRFKSLFLLIEIFEIFLFLKIMKSLIWKSSQTEWHTIACTSLLCWLNFSCSWLRRVSFVARFVWYCEISRS